jgi:PAS domain S-box-containing protein
MVQIMSLIHALRRELFEPQADHEDIRSWRERVLSIILFIVVVLGALVAVPSVLLALWEKLWLIAATDLVALAWVVAIWRIRSLSFHVRAWNFCAVLYLLGLSFLLMVGPTSQIYLMAFPVMTALLLGLRPALYALALNAVTLLGIGFLADADLQIPWLESQPLLKWIVITINFVFVNALITLTCVMLLQGLEKTLERKRDSEALYRATFDNAPVGVSHLDPDGRWLRVNPKLCDITGFSREEMLGLNYRDITHPDDLGPEVDRTAALLRGEIDSLDREKRYIRKDGQPIWVHLRTSLVRTASGEPRFLVAVATDITARKQSEEDLHRLNETLERKVAERTRELEAFTYSVAHDLRSPLRAIDGYSQLVLSDNVGKLDAESISHLQRMRVASQRLGDLIDDLLELSQVSRTDLRRQEVDLARMAAQIADELRERQPEREVTVTVPAQLMDEVDPYLARILLGNLNGNAWKYTGKVSPARIEFGGTEEDGRTVYFVRDNGSGFDMAYADKLFQPFQRLHSTAEFEGTGIGLSIVHRIVTRHEGKIWAEARKDEGATFFFTLG